MPRDGTFPVRGGRALDLLNFFVADVQTGFGPFVSVYLTTQRWTQFDIGLVQSAAGLISLVGQMPGGGNSSPNSVVGSPTATPWWAVICPGGRLLNWRCAGVSP